jgi:hypothetical protein
MIGNQEIGLFLYPSDYMVESGYRLNEWIPVDRPCVYVSGEKGQIRGPCLAATWSSSVPAGGIDVLVR